MKIIVLLFALTFGLFAAHIDEFATTMGYQRDYNQALALAKSENKPLMMVVVSDYCPWCRKFERKTLQRETIAMNVEKNFVGLIVDKNLDKGNYPDKYFAKRVPTVYFIDPKNEDTIFESLGYMKKDEYMQILEQTSITFKSVKK